LASVALIPEGEVEIVADQADPVTSSDTIVQILLNFDFGGFRFFGQSGLLEQVDVELQS